MSIFKSTGWSASRTWLWLEGAWKNHTQQQRQRIVVQCWKNIEPIWNAIKREFWQMMWKLFENKMSSELKKKLSKTLSTSDPPPPPPPPSILSRSYSTIGVAGSDDKNDFPNLGLSACYQREDSTLSTLSLPGGSAKKHLSKSKIPLPTFSRYGNCFEMAKDSFWMGHRVCHGYQTYKAAKVNVSGSIMTRKSTMIWRHLKKISSQKTFLFFDCRKEKHLWDLIELYLFFGLKLK